MKKSVDIICKCLYNKSCVAEESNADEITWRGIEVVITRRSWKPFVRKGAWVRIPPSPLQKEVKIMLDSTSCIWYIGRVVVSYLEKYPSWPKGLPWKGSRSLTAAHGFKSHLLRWYHIVYEMWYCNKHGTLTNKQ